MNMSRCPIVRALHPADLKSQDSRAIETARKHRMDAKARYTPLATGLLCSNFGIGTIIPHSKFYNMVTYQVRRMAKNIAT